ncbi:hypothetical protein niasHS_005013 [Heterodera schachtii]|uniref:Uncharacterized protein n=1 Tax=Heterodera schachtii TaxID=97005 RepID=A0ABD2JK96_HETSC
MLGNAARAENCAEWTDWGPCVWLRGDDPRWQRSYFDQLLPGRSGCRNHMFFKLLRERWGQAVSNVMDYFRQLTTSTKQCGFCSFQHSCGRRCHRRSNPMNPLFVAERHCDGVDQSASCVSRTNGAVAADECQLWPNRQIALPNVSDWMASMLRTVPFLNCVPQTAENGVRLCRCCCAPYAPNPAASFRCEILPTAAEDVAAAHSADSNSSSSSASAWSPFSVLPPPP